MDRHFCITPCKEVVRVCVTCNSYLLCLHVFGDYIDYAQSGREEKNICEQCLDFAVFGAKYYVRNNAKQLHLEFDAINSCMDDDFVFCLKWRLFHFLE